MLAQLTAVKSLVLLRRAQLDMAVAAPALEFAVQCIALELSDATTSTAKKPPGKAIQQVAVHGTPPNAGPPFQPKPGPLLGADLLPWLLRRLTLACAMATTLRLATTRALA